MSFLKRNNPHELPTGSDLSDALREAREEDGAASLDRRNFMRFLSASFAALSAGGCDFQPPRETIVPRLTEPEHAATGVAKWYASTCGACPAACGVLAKTREERPIKLEGNPDHPLSRGGLCARGQASVLDLYDSHRLKGPRANGEAVSWEKIDAEVQAALQRTRDKGKQVALLTPTLNGPATLSAVEKFKAAYPLARHVMWDAVGPTAVREAFRKTHGEARLPRYRIDRASVVVGLDADFLGTWLSPVEFMREWADARVRRVDADAPFLHLQFESRLSVTGANADRRFAVPPSRMRRLADALLHHVLNLKGESPSGEAAPASTSVKTEALEGVARRLIDAQGTGLVVCGSEDVETQTIVNRINTTLGHDGRTVDLKRPSYQFEGSAGELDALIRSMKDGEIGALIVWGCNPAHATPSRDAFVEALKNVDWKISLTGAPDETTVLMDYQCPDHHALEAWGDSHPAAGWLGLTQPTLAPLHDTRSAAESLLRWAGEELSAYEHLRKTWREEVFPKQEEHETFESFWAAALKQGGWALAEEAKAAIPLQGGMQSPVEPENAGTSSSGDFEFVAYASPALFDGRQANNPWLQELPDPITKATWGNPLLVSPADAPELGLEEGALVRLSSDDTEDELEAPVLIQPGMPRGVVAGALGYGRPHAGPVAANWPEEEFLPLARDEGNGTDFYPLLNTGRVKIQPTGRSGLIAKTQVYDHQELPFTGEARELARNVEPAEPANKGTHGEGDGHATMWEGHTYDGQKWSMSIDLDRCTGCSACVIACQAENNIPTVGKLEVSRQREMHWLRLDRYYSGSEAEPDDQPEVSFQPMLCQHCDHAPCETVCPVLATVHNDEGLNVQIYNRCIGTRFCANNCPYKVRRFNWFDYMREEPLPNLVLNPDVTVRSRGVMEKCTFCVQRINRGKREAGAEGRAVADGDITPACAQSCPARAIVFGDINDTDSRVHELKDDPRGYHVLEDLGTKPSVQYLARVNFEDDVTDA